MAFLYGTDAFDTLKRSRKTRPKAAHSGASGDFFENGGTPNAPAWAHAAPYPDTAAKPRRHIVRTRLQQVRHAGTENGYTLANPGAVGLQAGARGRAQRTLVRQAWRLGLGLDAPACDANHPGSGRPIRGWLPQLPTVGCRHRMPQVGGIAGHLWRRGPSRRSVGQSHGLRSGLGPPVAQTKRFGLAPR
jgi:hypothetical protein